MSSGHILESYAYVDGAYLRTEGAKISIPFPNPKIFVEWVVNRIQSIGGHVRHRRTSFYDAEPSDKPPTDLEQYWAFVEDQWDTELRFGEVRGRPRRQKGVDVLLAVDMLSASFHHLFDVAVLVAGDADFVPLVREVRRLGVAVVVAGIKGTTARELRTAADRFVALDSELCGAWIQEPFMPNRDHAA
jgi:uncharacterized LabA/DUF88 family protein